MATRKKTPGPKSPAATSTDGNQPSGTAKPAAKAAPVSPDSGTTLQSAASQPRRSGGETVDAHLLLTALTAIKRGDFSFRMPLDATGITGKVYDTLNDVIDLEGRFLTELDRMSSVVGREGRLSERSSLDGAVGGWSMGIDSVNALISGLGQPTTELTRVIDAVSRGVLSQEVPLDVDGNPIKGEFLKAARIVNRMVSQLRAFSSEVTRVAREVGTDGILGGQAQVPDVTGVWRDLTDNVNAMASNLTSQVRDIAQVATAVANGDLNQKVAVEVKGEILELKGTINNMVDQLNAFSGEVTRVARDVGTEGMLGGQADVPGAKGTWRDLTDNVNTMASNLTNQVRNIAQVATAVASGDLNQKITVEVKGEVLQLKDTINAMVEQLNAFSNEVTRVARDVGTEGVLGGQAKVAGVAGVWKDLTENVNTMASNLTSQVRDIAQVTTAVARGDLSQKITVEVKGEVLDLKDTINLMVDQLTAFSTEVTRVARDVGTEGVLGGRAEVAGVAGVWKDLTDNVNAMASNLTSQVRDIAQVATAVANGDLSQQITVEVKGEILKLKETLNNMVEQLNAFSGEVTRVARDVGTEGVLGGQADVPGARGIWRDLTDNVNALASNLTSQVRDIAQVTTAVARGDLSQKITVEVKGEILELKDTINDMVEQLNSFSDEVTRVARDVGTEGVLGGQADVPGVAGVWKDLTDNVNAMASNLTSQVRDIAQVATAVSNGDLTQNVTVEVKGEMLELKDTLNNMVEQLNAFSGEVTRMARDVGTEGVLGGQADVPGARGTWRELTDNVNTMASNLTSQVRNIAQVATAVANGDLSQMITVEVKGEILELKDTLNNMVEQLTAFSTEVTRVAREVGTEGGLGGQAEVPGVAGVWKDLTDNVNTMASNLTSQVRDIARVSTAIGSGDLSQKVTVEVKGEILDLKETINLMVDQLRSFSSEVTRVAQQIGVEGILGGQADVPGVAGVWKDLTDNVNRMASNLTNQVRNIARVATAIGSGDLSQKITIDVKGEILLLKDGMNTMVDQLNAFSGEVTRVAREVGTEGVLGGQANVPGVAGVWKDLTDNVNTMSNNLTDQVRGIARVITAVGSGDLRRKVALQARGEVAELADTINLMTDTLSTFADQVTTVAREVGVEGRLGGEARVPDAQGVWRDLTGNVNLLASNLTSQVRAISEVATSVTEGDLTRAITVEASGEVALLKDTVNKMIGSLRETTVINSEQDWLKTNLARFTGLMQGQKDITEVANLVLSELASTLDIKHGVFYLNDTEASEAVLNLVASYAYTERKHLSKAYRISEGLVGQCAFEKKRITLTNVPTDYVKISSGLGEATPLSVVVFPVIFEGQMKGVVELATFNSFTEIQLTFVDQLADVMGIGLSSIAANIRTEQLLKDSQTLTEELQTQQEELTESNQQLEQQAGELRASEELLKTKQDELQQTNEELEEKAQLLATQKLDVESARSGLQEKAEQLALTSKYKSEFLANMSHELRTPLNSMLILSRLMSENEDGNLTEKQMEFAETIQSSGADLLELINEILDLAKIESGTVSVEASSIFFDDLVEFVNRSFHQVANEKNLGFDVQLAEQLPESLNTDSKRLKQVLKNMLSNAFKFTESGQVTLKIAPATQGWSPDHTILNAADSVVAFAVTDTGIGIPEDKRMVIFEAFQQAEGSTSRRYGGTGLGLSISREVVRMIGGEIHLESEVGQGSTFTVYLPLRYVPLASVRGPGPGPKHAPDPKPISASIPKETSPPVQTEVPDDRNQVQPGDRVLLILEDDVAFARILLDLAREKGFKGLVALRGDEGLRLAKQLHPDAMTLDLALPAMDGIQVLDRLKHDPVTRHIPVHIISAAEDQRKRCLTLGALSYLAKPADMEALQQSLTDLKAYVDRPVRRLLIVEDDEAQRNSIVELIGNHDVEARAVASGEGALALLEQETFDCLVIDLGLPEMSGFELIDAIRANEKLAAIPILVYTGRELTHEEDTELRRVAEAIIIKDVKSMERLLDETALFLHRVEADLPEPKRRILKKVHQKDPILGGTTILIVDDDVRNIFALTSVLERHDVKVFYAENGPDALGLLDGHPEVDLVLLDVMMPDMDGYETVRAIRSRKSLANLPVIAVTAKAMKGDRERFIDAGGSDYLTKPVDTEQLLSLTRVWLYR